MTKQLHICAFLLGIGCVSVIGAAPFIAFDWIPLGIGENPWQNERLEDGGESRHSNRAYHKERYYPSYVFIHDAAQKGDSILWNPYEYGGVPFMASWYTRCYSFFTLPFYFLPLALSWKLSVLLKFFIAGGSTAYVTRKLGMTYQASLLCAILYLCSTIFFIHGGEPISDCAPWFPLLFLFAERLAHGQYRYWPLGAVALSLMCMGGDGLAVMIGLTYTVIYLALRALALHKMNNVFGIGVAFGLMGIVGVGLSSIQLIPWWTFKETTTLITPGSFHWPSIAEAGAIILPGLVEHGSSTSFHLGWVSLLTILLYVAVRPTLFKPQQRQMDSMAALAVVPWALIPVLSLVFGGSHPQIAVIHVVFPAIFFGSLLSAITLETWLSLNPEQCRSVLKRLLFYFPTLIVVLLLWIGITFYREHISVAQLSIQLGLMTLCVLLYLVCLGRTLVKPSLPFLVMTMSVVAVLNVCALFPFIPHTKATEIASNSPTIAMIQETDNRIGVSPDWVQWPLSVFQISQIEGLGGYALSPYAQYWKQAQEDPQLYVQTAASLLLTKTDIQEDYKNLRPQLAVEGVSSEGAVLFNYIHPLGRVRMVDAVRQVDSFDPNMLSPFYPPLLEGEIPDIKLPETPSAPQIVYPESHDQLIIRCKNSGPGLLMVADTWEAGWNAYVDGSKAEILKVNGAFRGVIIGEDTAEVRFQYEPDYLIKGRWGTGISLIVTLFGFINVVLYRFHNRYMRVSP
jgi:hypothetical protein